MNLFYIQIDNLISEKEISLEKFLGAVPFNFELLNSLFVLTLTCIGRIIWSTITGTKVYADPKKKIL